MESERTAVWASAISIAIVAARWLPVAGIGEYGMLYDQAYRLSVGQVWYRDLLSTHPPIAAQTLGALFRLFEPSLLLYNVHLYLWWLASLLVGYLLLRRYDVQGLARSAALVTFASLSLPCLSLGHAYFYAGSVFCGLCVLCLDIGLDGSRPSMTFGAGLLAGVTVFARQNLGIALIGGAVFLYLPLFIKKSLDLPGVVKQLAALLSGFVLSCLTIFLIFSRAASPGEVLRELLLDGAHGKAGQYGLLVRLIPRVNLKATLIDRRLMEIAGSIVVYLAVLWWVARRRSGSDPQPTSSSGKPLTVAIGLWVFANFVTLIPANVGHWMDSSTWPVIATASGAIIDLINIGWLTGMAWFLIASWNSMAAQTVARTVLALSVFAGTILSSQSYSVHLASVLVPMTIATLGSTFPKRAIIQRLCLLTSIWAIAAIFSLPTAFTRLVPIAGPRQFVGIWTTTGYAREAEELLNHVTPVIQNRTVLWVDLYGPHAAFGGMPAASVVPWDKTTFTSRQVSYLLGRWRANPPEYVMSGPFWGREELLGPQSEFDQWLGHSYTENWCSALQPELCLWKKK
jgi:hypothetical protein